MRVKRRNLIVFALMPIMTACNWGTPKAPTGQVVATVGSREITLRELRSELGELNSVRPADQRAQQQRLVQLLVQRAVLAQAALDAGLDKDPNFVLLKERVINTLLVQQLQKKIAADVPAPTVEEAVQFQAANPYIFSERKIFDVDQIRLARTADNSVLAKLQPLKTLDEVAALLAENHLAFQRGRSSIDTVGQDPKLASAIAALPPTEVFIISAGNQVLINQIVQGRTQPFVGDAATKYALNIIKAQRTQQAVQRKVSTILAKAKDSIHINKDYQLPTNATPKPSGK